MLKVSLPWNIWKYKLCIWATMPLSGISCMRIMSMKRSGFPCIGLNLDCIFRNLQYIYLFDNNFLTTSKFNFLILIILSTT